MEPQDVQLSTETHCTLAGMALRDALRHMHRATRAYESDSTDDEAEKSLRALRDLTWSVLPQMTDVIADQLGYEAGKAA